MAVKKKLTGLAQFTGQKVQTAGAVELSTNPAPAQERTRGKGDTVALTIRVSRQQWEKLHQLDIAEGVSLQALALRGFTQLFKEKGLPGL